MWHWESVLHRWDYFLAGLLVTFNISFCSLALSFGLGLGLAICRISPVKGIRILSVAYIDLFRNTPFLVQLFFFYYGLPEIGINTHPIATGIIALSLTTSTHQAEAIRAGIQAVDRGVIDAGSSQGFSRFQLHRFIILPIALQTALKPLLSIFINLVLTTSTLSTITVNDLMGNAMNISAETFRPFEVYLTVLFLYCLITFSLSAVFNTLYALFFSRSQPRLVLRSG